MSKRVLPVLGLIMLCNNVTIAQENEWSSARPDGHAPISVMGDHYHKKGEVMVSYRNMPMWMSGTLKSTSDIENMEVYQNYMVSPQNMQMNMHMIGAMYAPTDNITLALMGNYISNSMDLRTMMGMEFTTQSGGFGDTKFSTLVKIFNKNRQSLHGNLGVSIPTGNIDQRDDTPMMANAQLAYPMQLGTGTWDPNLGLTYLGQTDRFSWGAQAKYVLRFGENTEDYRFGNQFNVVGWGAIKVSENFSFSASLNYSDSQSIEGTDADLNPMMMPLFNTVNSGRSQLDAGIGANFYIAKGKLKNLRIAIEVQAPAYQKVNGIQMKRGIQGTVGAQYVLGHK